MERCFLFGLTPPLGATAIQGAPDPRRVHGGGIRRGGTGSRRGWDYTLSTRARPPTDVSALLEPESHGATAGRGAPPGHPLCTARVGQGPGGGGGGGYPPGVPDSSDGSAAWRPTPSGLSESPHAGSDAATWCRGTSPPQDGTAGLQGLRDGPSLALRPMPMCSASPPSDAARRPAGTARLHRRAKGACGSRMGGLPVPARAASRAQPRHPSHHAGSGTGTAGGGYPLPQIQTPTAAHPVDTP